MIIPIDKWTLILKIGAKWSFSYETKASTHLSQWGECAYGVQLWKERRLLRESMFTTFDRRTLILKNGGKWSFSYEINASISFIPIRRMCLSCPFKKRKEIISWIHDYPNWQMNFDSKNWCEVKLFLWNQSINSFVPMRRMRLWCPIMKRKEIITWIHVYHIW